MGRQKQRLRTGQKFQFQRCSHTGLAKGSRGGLTTQSKVGLRTGENSETAGGRSV